MKTSLGFEELLNDWMIDGALVFAVQGGQSCRDSLRKIRGEDQVRFSRPTKPKPYRPNPTGAVPTPRPALRGIRSSAWRRAPSTVP